MELQGGLYTDSDFYIQGRGVCVCVIYKNVASSWIAMYFLFTGRDLARISKLPVRKVIYTDEG